MSVNIQLSEGEAAVLEGRMGSKGQRMALEIVLEAARILGAERLVPIKSAHIDGCLYHGASGTLFCERLVELGAQTTVPATTNVGALNLLKPAQSRLSGEARKMAFRLMVAHERLGCVPSWTCAPYQAGARPGLGAQVAWGESNAVAFCNSVLGARTNRYGDFLDIACAIAGRAPYYGLHVAENRHATMLLDLSDIPADWQQDEVFFPVLGALIGRLAGARVCAVKGIQGAPGEDQLKALCAGAASTGAVGLVHLIGITPEAPDQATAFGGRPARDVRVITPRMMIEAKRDLSRADTGHIDAVALGSPHFSSDECRALLAMARDTPFKVPVYVCLGRHSMIDLERDNTSRALEALGVVFVLDTCVVVTPILPDHPGVLMTNSAKFAHYAKGNTGYDPVFGSLHDCVASAQAGRVVGSRGGW
ncbi:DUF521 domain-containing protein [Roseobacter denitrificans]|uniref:Phosphomevalonate dehydratase large subunit-like domain-containing protein n=1 Tax=Roseobacter denitrificans (strain ATCC 33942 / OCh 114) TaxID=375451 RepID=Q161U4_ROSDO|nr:aconitase X catalytic domain-containing protein [Roseobacter denitrificans]ABG33249.1 conserved hypothetical protein [Roseobacter denitrificans OCh 114]AVL52591.1 DUF521 domain-containing protein [Roseobacter denitrificans]SFG30566.1 predicted aconitase subunit 1 [Roseobacter denitrificans OCh 114]